MVRDKRIDVGKAIGIILVVMGHAGFPYSSVLFRFHMALFFWLSGWCFRDECLKDFSTYINYSVKKIKGLYIPFILFNGITLALRNWLIKINIYTDNVSFLETSMHGGGNSFGITVPLALTEMKPWILNVIYFNGESQLGGATWFLRVLFGVTVLFAGINYILKTVARFSENSRAILNACISLFLLVVSYNWMKNDVHLFLQFETVASSYGIYTMGYYMRSFWPRMSNKQNIVIALISLNILCYYDRICMEKGYSSNVNFFDDPFIFMITSLSGILLVLSISCIIVGLKEIKILEYIGKHTLIILFWHFLAFKSVTAIQIVLYGDPIYRLASFPVYNSEGVWWIVYTIFGLALPLILSWILSRLKTCKLKSTIMKVKNN